MEQKCFHMRKHALSTLLIGGYFVNLLFKSDHSISLFKPKDFLIFSFSFYFILIYNNNFKDKTTKLVSTKNLTIHTLFSLFFFCFSHSLSSLFFMSDEHRQPYFQNFMLDHNNYHQKTDQGSINNMFCEKQFSTNPNLGSSYDCFDPSSYNMSFTECLQGGNMDHHYNSSSLANNSPFGVLSPSSSEVFSSVDQGNNQKQEVVGGETLLNSSISNSSSSEAGGGGGAEEEDSGKKKKNIGQVKEEPGQEATKNG
jgi:hypothetical protein